MIEYFYGILLTLELHQPLKIFLHNSLSVQPLG